MTTDIKDSLTRLDELLARMAQDLKDAAWQLECYRRKELMLDAVEPRQAAINK